jgi:signal transduction histidine kinase
MTSLLGPILVVDDNEAGRYAKARVLRRAEFEVFEAGTGKAALELLERHKPPLVVLDINLPDVNGMDLCRQIKRRGATASTLVLQISATYVTTIDTVRSLDAGADASLVEPVDPTVLVATVKALLRTRQAEDAVRKALAHEQSARASAESANRLKDEFLATLSHELRSPLGAILTWVTLLRSTAPNAEYLDRGLGAIERNTRHQAKLIEDLLDVSRIISGKMQLDAGRVDLRAVVTTVVEALTPSPASKDIRLTTRFEGGVRPIRGDPARVHQIVSNLLSNAIKFTPEGGQVELLVRQQTDSVEIRVTDTGAGIDPRFLPHVFERFRQADSSSTRHESGLGLGLAIVRHLVELHGGRAGAASGGPGQGATFTVWLPSDPSDSFDDEPVQRARVADTIFADAPLANLSVLVVDDDADSREANVVALRSAGAQTQSIDNVRDAIALVDTTAIDVVVSDIGLPGEDGYSLIRALRSRDESKRIAALALTAYASIVDQRRILAAGYDAFLAKPTAASELVGTVLRVSRAPDAARVGTESSAR